MRTEAEEAQGTPQAEGQEGHQGGAQQHKKDAYVIITMVLLLKLCIKKVFAPSCPHMSGVCMDTWRMRCPSGAL